MSRLSPYFRISYFPYFLWLTPSVHQPRMRFLQPAYDLILQLKRKLRHFLQVLVGDRASRIVAGFISFAVENLESLYHLDVGMNRQF